MSRAYRIKVSETLRRHIKVGDGVQSSLEILNVLSPERMTELLERALRERGFEREGEVLVRRDTGGIEVTVDPREGTVTVRLSEESAIELERTKTKRAARPDEGTEKLRAEVRASLERQADEVERQIQERLSRRLDQALADIQQELDGVVNRTTAEALKERAAQLGEIEEISEDAQSGSLTIRVRV